MTDDLLVAVCLAVCVLSVLGLFLLHHCPNSRLTRYADEEIER